MTHSDRNDIGKDEIAHLAFLNWQNDGCPSGNDLNYWLEAESQLRATKHLMAAEQADRKLPQQGVAAKPEKNKQRTPRKTTVRKELVG